MFLLNRSKLACVAAFGLLASACLAPEKTAQNADIPAETLSSTDDFATTDTLIADRDALPGAALYAQNCAYCHQGGVAKAPHFNWLEMMPPRAIVNAMAGGVMTAQASALSETQHLQIAEYITRQPVSGGLPPVPNPPVCEGRAAVFDKADPPAAVNWGHDARRMIAQDVAGMVATDTAALELKWAFAFPGATRARSQPAFGYGAVYVGSADGNVYAFDAASGCLRWRFEASAEVRTAMVLSTDPEAPGLYFGDIIANFYALDPLTGALMWQVKLDDHPSATLTGSPLYHDGTLYAPVSSLEVIPAADPAYACCTFRGSLAALDAQSGAEKWRFYPIPEQAKEVGETPVGTPIMAPSGAPIWISPMLDEKRGVLYVGTGENYSSPAGPNSDAIFAVDIKTGKRVWQRQTIAGDAWNVACMMESNPNCPKEDGPDFDHSASILLVDLPSGGDILIAGHKNGHVYGLDPDNKGALLWSTKVGRGSIQGGVHFGLAADGDVLYVPINDMNNTRNGDVLDPALARPGVHALSAQDGRILWSAVQENLCSEDRPFCDPGVSAALTAFEGGVIAGHLDGYLRAYDKATGRILWAHDTTQTVTGVNGLAAKGGGMSGPGVAASKGYLAANSGYGLYYHEPGNAFLMFGLPEDTKGP
ncbi:MAG: PQQ-binding-like beta-propeller repeat protein [Pseudomonadota bacterium]